ncbi:hypothetical protein [Sphingobacterium siyangense]|uniref:hypothetical protein n=1 Tax=Sphingobacterium siyangense TaxID=459529 RepID=UPI003C75BEFF
MRSFLLTVIANLVNFTYSYAQKDPELRIALSNMNAATVALDTQGIFNTTSPRLIISFMSVIKNFSANY